MLGLIWLEPRADLEAGLVVVETVGILRPESLGLGRLSLARGGCCRFALKLAVQCQQGLVDPVVNDAGGTARLEIRKTEEGLVQFGTFGAVDRLPDQGFHPQHILFFYYKFFL